ncbi:MAG: OmpA family protein [Polyangiaceae bacterium]|nr:OmpA family protein [Polyangiaceae bacterium]NUQ74421.1 OmpA family protein [Polyangiaceae bacterium]
MRPSCALLLSAFLLSSAPSCIFGGAETPSSYEPPDERLILFNFGSADVNAEGHFALGYAAAYLDVSPSMHVLIVGHSDGRGTREANRDMSFRRARSARKILLEHGVAANRILIAAPRAKEGTSMPALSRRADVYVYDPVKDEISKRLGYEVELRAE